MEKRVYLTKVVKITKFMAGESVEMQVPYLSHLPVDPPFGSDYHWDVVYDHNGDPNGITPGIHHKCFVGIYCETSDHLLLENDPEMIRMDDLL